MTEAHDNVRLESAVSKNGTVQYVEITVKFIVPSTKRVKSKKAVRRITEAIEAAASNLDIAASKKAQGFVCVYCGSDIDQVSGRGRPKKFCSNSCRQKDYKQKRKAKNDRDDRGK